MTNRTDQRTGQPSPVLTEPSYAAQILLTTAAILDMHPTAPLTPSTVDQALRVAADAIVSRLPAVVAADSSHIARQALPTSAGITRGEYALRLRTAAKGI
ncbi:hypothetical protein [Streptomyces sp. NPDC058614]|uniref:hypothetical protein n=1 Tax=Streptomyces sp. NPDC058614 TaxID=3346557 RepID=UPI003660FE6B